jgi:hypothetical protein
MDWLMDKSALVRLGGSRDTAEWPARIERGLDEDFEIIAGVTGQSPGRLELS